MAIIQFDKAMTSLISVIALTIFLPMVVRMAFRMLGIAKADPYLGAIGASMVGR